ncbi:hypothetical protein N7478_012589 [Penicillium angulare]|uniref:uncharacterized protein n=1 Tax=Penicillium angulare TaxID=116970 RepID=UPI002541E083|nr:uncharacterized protein N7478_012589 [Penicillium angulare]KAJ5259608.1 hypothetical protein N7478_012589 [Penicillium angulare]
MGAVEEGCASQGFFGSSSAAGFMRQIKTAIDKRISSPDPHSLTPSLALRSSLLSGRREGLSSGTSYTQNYVLPPRRTADRLMSVYWEYVFPLYPFVDSNAMKVEYTNVWKGETLQRDEHMVMCTFNVIFALASQLADFIPPEERESSADIFFSRSKDLFQFNLWDTGSAGLIQCLLLMAQYLQSTDSAHQCWIVTGLAIRNAQSLGLHMPQTVASFRSFHEQQLARKLWHGCVLMDRVISMTFGRPAMISRFSSETVPLPKAVDDELIIASNISEPMQPESKPSIMAFYAKTLELYEIMNNVLLSLYKPVLDDSQEDMHDFYFNSNVNEGDRSIFELDRSLTQWTRSLPSHLQGDSSVNSENLIFMRQSIVLRERFLHVRMLLFRPTLSKYCGLRDMSPEQSMIPIQDSFPHRVASQCSIICVQAAQESIQLIYSNIPSNGSGGPLPAWWYNILYVYTSATVLLAGKLCPAIKAEIPITTISHSWNCALEILRNYQIYSKSARRCVAALEILHEKVVHEGQLPADDVFGSSDSANILNDLSFGEGMNAAVMEGFDLPDFQDMSWLNSVPSNLL